MRQGLNRLAQHDRRPGTRRAVRGRARRRRIGARPDLANGRPSSTTRCRVPVWSAQSPNRRRCCGGAASRRAARPSTSSSAFCTGRPRRRAVRSTTPTWPACAAPCGSTMRPRAFRSRRCRWRCRSTCDPRRIRPAETVSPVSILPRRSACTIRKCASRTSARR